MKQNERKGHNIVSWSAWHALERPNRLIDAFVFSFHCLILLRYRLWLYYCLNLNVCRLGKSEGLKIDVLKNESFVVEAFYEL